VFERKFPAEVSSHRLFAAAQRWLSSWYLVQSQPPRPLLVILHFRPDLSIFLRLHVVSHRLLDRAPTASSRQSLLASWYFSARNVAIAEGIVIQGLGGALGALK
jgi:hypothetical protein